MLRRVLAAALLVALLQSSPEAARAAHDDVADLGDRLELFVDRQQVERTEGVSLVLHRPEFKEVALRFDAPWEGRHSAYVTVFRDGPRFRMYYRGLSDARTGKSEQLTCYAESKDGIHWSKPELGLFEFEGSKRNNIVWTGPGNEGTHNFAPFKDERPGVPESEHYKALGGGPLYAFASPDGLHWRRLVDHPVVTKGAFDSQNLAFWDPNHGRYSAYFRIFTRGVRAIATAHSADFVHWSDTVPIELGATPAEHFYTNATVLYFRAPHYYFSFPKRFVPGRKRLPEHPEQGISDGVFLSSRDALHFDRTFLEAFIRPGLDPNNWGDRSNMTACGLVQTGPGTMSLYVSQNYGFPTSHMRRVELRLDGIASASAGAQTGELVTKPLRFRGSKLVLNFATSAAGSVRVEVQEPSGSPVAGFALEQGRELFGDAISEAYTWSSGASLASLAGKPVRLRFVLKDADLYSYRFGD